MTKTIILIILLPLSYGVFGQVQNAEIRKLQQALKRTSDSTLQADLLNRIAFLYYERNIDSTFFYTQKARQIANRHNYEKGEADALNNIGVIYDVQGYSRLAINYYNQAYKIYTTLHDTSNQVQTLMNMASVYINLGNGQKARHYFDAAHAASRGLKRDSIMSLFYQNYLLCYESTLSDDSIAYYTNLANAIATKYDDTRTLLAIASVSAGHLIHKGKIKEGTQLSEKVIADALDQQIYFASLDMMATLGDELMPIDSVKAIYYYQQGLALAQKNNYAVYNRIFSEKLYSIYKTAQNPYPKSFYSDQYIKALEHEMAIESASALDYTDYALKEDELKLSRASEQIRLILLIFMCVLAVTGCIFVLVIRKNLKRTKRLNILVMAQNVSMQQTLASLEQSHAENTRMMKVVAHDLRGPISGISTIAEMMLEDPARSAEDREIFQLIKDTGDNLQELANDLLVLKTKDEDLHREPTDIGELLQQCVGLFAGTAREKQQAIELNTFSMVIPASREKLWRVISNLITNAIKFSASGTTIFMGLENLDDSILISIKDNGIGIPDNIGEKIFQLQTSAGRTGTQGEQSFGMGLAISKQIVEAHGGKLWFEPNPEGGTIFYIKLPKLPSHKNILKQTNA